MTSLDTTVATFVTCCTVRARSGGVDTITAFSDGITARAVLHVGFLGFTSVAVGYAGACGLAVDSVAYCWSAAHPTHPRATLPLTALSGDGACGLSVTGAAYCLGNSAIAVGQGHTYTSLTVGGTFACGLDVSGSAWCWNSGYAGQLGNGDTVSSTTPVAVSGGHTFAVLSAGSDHACGIASDSTAYCWGSNGGGMLGAGDTSVHISAVPRLVIGGLKFTTISAGFHHTCAVTTTGDAYCWGGDGYLGTGSFGPTASPVLVSGGLTFLSIGVTSSGYLYGTCGLTTAGVYCWGNGLTGVDGLSLTLAPVKVQGQQ